MDKGVIYLRKQCHNHVLNNTLFQQTENIPTNFVITGFYDSILYPKGQTLSLPKINCHITDGPQYNVGENSCSAY